MEEIFDDIRKLYAFQEPGSELRPFIEFFSQTSPHASEQHFQSRERTSVRLFPSFTPTIWFNLGPAYLLRNGRSRHQVGAQTDVLVLRNEIIERNFQSQDDIFTIKFQPGGLEAVLGHSQTRIGSKTIEAQQVLPAAFIRKLKQTDGFAERVRLLEDFFRNALALNYPKTVYLRYIREAIYTYCGSGMDLSNAALADRLYLTEKTLYRYFKRVVGAHPKQYLATVRARTALTAYVSDQKVFSPYDFGYYDHSHFSKEVWKFTGRRLSDQSK